MKVNKSNLTDYIIRFECEDDFTGEEQIELFSYLLKTGMAWKLQGFYGRTATAMIEAGYLDKSGKILKGI